MKQDLELMPESADPSVDHSGSIADLFLAASRELANSDVRLYRSLDRHLKLTRELLDRDDDQSHLIGEQPNSYPLLGSAHSYDRQTRRSLQELCRDNGITGYSRMTKKVMIERLVAKGIEAPEIPLEALSKAELIEALRHMIDQQRHA